MQHLSFLIQPNEPSARQPKVWNPVGQQAPFVHEMDFRISYEDQKIGSSQQSSYRSGNVFGLQHLALARTPVNFPKTLQKVTSWTNGPAKRPSLQRKRQKQDFLRNLMQGPQRAFIIEQIAFCWLALTIFKWQRKEESETFICLFSGRTGVLSPKQTRKIRISNSIVEVAPEKVYYGKRKFTMVKIKDDPSPISIGGYISILSKLYLFC